jgi:hypothetical protein
VQGATTLLDQICSGGWGSNESTRPVAYEGYTSGQPGGQHELFIEACATNASGVESLAFEVPLFGAGQASTDSAELTLSDGTNFQATNGVTVGITVYGPEHERVEGTYYGTMQTSSGSKYVEGSFRLCHVGAFLPP